MSASRLPVFYINLATRPDRREFMQRQFETLGITGERVEAVTTAEVPADLLAYHAGPDSLWRLRAGDLACGLSHQRAWRRLLNTEAPAALILEDDAILTPPVLEFLDPDAFALLDADLVKLETFRKRVKLGSIATRVGTTLLRELCSSQMGGAAYLIRRAPAQRSLESPLRNSMGVDRLLFGRGGLHLLRSRVLQAWPSPCIQLDKTGLADGAATSDIAPDRLRYRGGASLTRMARQLGLHSDHLARLGALALRDPGALVTRRRPVPFIGDPSPA